MKSLWQVATVALFLCQSGCICEFEAWRYPAPIQQAKRLIELKRQGQRLPAGEFDYADGQFYAARKVPDMVKVPISKQAPKTIAVYWETAERPCTLPARDFEAVGRVWGYVGAAWLLADRSFFDQYFRRAADALGGDAVIEAAYGILLPTYPGVRLHGTVIRFKRDSGSE